MNRIIRHLSGLALALLIKHAFCLLLPEAKARAAGVNSAPNEEATIDVDAAKVTGKASPYIFGQNMEHEHGTISGGEQNLDNAHGLHSGGLWAEMLRDRKLEEGDVDGDGIANARVQCRLRHWAKGRGLARRGGLAKGSSAEAPGCGDMRPLRGTGVSVRSRGVGRRCRGFLSVTSAFRARRGLGRGSGSGHVALAVEEASGIDEEAGGVN